jgi:hypothetical protein
MITSPEGILCANAPDTEAMMINLLTLEHYRPSLIRYCFAPHNRESECGICCTSRNKLNDAVEIAFFYRMRGFIKIVGRLQGAAVGEIMDDCWMPTRTEN